jgi:hypothetical protein
MVETIDNPALRSVLDEHADAIRASAKSTVKSVLEIGQRLKRIPIILKHSLHA